MTRRLIGALALTVLLAGCSSAAKKPAAHTPASTSAVVPIPSAAVSSSDSQYDIPRCDTLVGKPASDVVVPKKGPQCITGASVAEDSTAWGTEHCVDAKSGAKVTAYHWVSNNPGARDTAEYVARSDGPIMVLPEGDGSAAQNAIVASIYLALGCV